MIAVFLADGFEEIEALAVVDILRRADLDVKTVSINPTKTVEGAHGIAVTADMLISDLDSEQTEAVVLPGGMPGTTNLEACDGVTGAIDSAVRRGAWVCAICAAPSILGKKGLLNGRRATVYPSFADALIGAQIPEDGVVCDGRFITGRGPGVAVDFGLEMVRQMVSPEAAESIKASMQCP